MTHWEGAIKWKRPSDLARDLASSFPGGPVCGDTLAEQLRALLTHIADGDEAAAGATLKKLLEVCAAPPFSLIEEASFRMKAAARELRAAEDAVLRSLFHRRGSE